MQLHVLKLNFSVVADLPSVSLQLPDYHDIIKHPMDFGTVRKKLDDGEYSNLEQFEVSSAIVLTDELVLGC